jgi:hypothetical protein
MAAGGSSSSGKVHNTRVPPGWPGLAAPCTVELRCLPEVRARLGVFEAAAE